jgi:hypothetical protein
VRIGWSAVGDILHRSFLAVMHACIVKRPSRPKCCTKTEMERTRNLARRCEVAGLPSAIRLRGNAKKINRELLKEDLDWLVCRRRSSSESMRKGKQNSRVARKVCQKALCC